MVVLNENIRDAQVGKRLLVVCLQEKPSRIADDFRLEFPDSGKRCIQSLQVSQNLVEEGCLFTDPKNINNLSESTAECCGGASAWKIGSG